MMHTANRRCAAGRVFAIAAALLLAAGIGGGCSILEEPAAVPSQPSSSASEGASSSSSSSSASSQGQLGKMKPIETVADTQEAIAHEKKMNQDTVGWLRIPDTNISNSVVQSHDNLYYLRLTERKQPDTFGCYFADYECSFGARDRLSPNTVIYGHSDLKDTPDGLRFSQLFQFTDEEFARKHPYIYFSTIEDYMVWEIFAVFYTDTGMKLNSVKLDAAGLGALAQEAKSKSIYQYDTTVSGEDKILTLSTCTVKYGARKDQRFVVMAKLLPKDTEESSVASLSVNPNPVQPDFQS